MLEKLKGSGLFHLERENETAEREGREKVEKSAIMRLVCIWFGMTTF